MKLAMHRRAPHLVLNATTAAELMTANPVSIDEDATVSEAVALFINKRFGVAPVINKAGRPIGVLSASDILIHDREKVDYVPTAETSRLATPEGEALGPGFLVENVDTSRVADLMTPGIFAVTPETQCAKLIAEFQRLKVHHLFVVDRAGTLVGVISSLDILRRLEA